MKIGVLSFFTPNINGHGGEKRSYQVRQLFDNAIFIELFHFKEPVTIWQRIIICIPTLVSVRILMKIKRVKLSKSFFKDTRRINSFILENRNYINKIDLVIWESNTYDTFFIPYVLKQYFKVKVFAFPHNLETLVYNNKVSKGESIIRELGIELKSLKQCDRVFVISREENWLLKLLSIDTFYLPYYLKSSFKKKDSSQNKNILLIGSINNPPTGIGMRDVIEYFIQNLDLFHGMNLNVVGYGSEIFKHLQTNRVLIHGSVSHLECILAEMDIILINQMPSSGALTKIIEFTEMGFKIICNVDSKRSYFDFDNVYEYNQLKEIPEIIQSINCSKIKNTEIERVINNINYAVEKFKN